MKRILIIAPSSFPINGAEGIVNAKFIYVLSKQGYHIDVISKKHKWASFPQKTVKNLTKSISSIHEIEVNNKLNFDSIIAHLKVFLKTGYVYKGAHWAIHAIKIAEKLLNKNKYDAILTRNPPSEIVGLYLAKKYKIKWIANWNDPYPNIKYPSPYGKGKEARLSHSIGKLLSEISKYSAIQTFPSERLKDYMCNYLGEIKAEVIPHICLPDLISNKTTTQKSNKLRIIHAGRLTSPRNPEPFFKGLSSFVKKVPKANIEIAFLGAHDNDLEDLVNRFELQNYITILPSQPYIESLVTIQNYDLALLIEAPVAEGIFLPSKIIDYMQCHREIFAISPKIGTLKDLHLQNKIKYFSDCENEQNIENTLVSIYSDFLNLKINNSNYIIPAEFTPDIIIQKFNTIFERYCQH